MELLVEGDLGRISGGLVLKPQPVAAAREHVVDAETRVLVEGLLGELRVCQHHVASLGDGSRVALARDQAHRRNIRRDPLRRDDVGRRHRVEARRGDERSHRHDHERERDARGEDRGDEVPIRTRRLAPAASSDGEHGVDRHARSLGRVQAHEREDRKEPAVPVQSDHADAGDEADQIHDREQRRRLARSQHARDAEDGEHHLRPGEGDRHRRRDVPPEIAGRPEPVGAEVGALLRGELVKRRPRRSGVERRVRRREDEGQRDARDSDHDVPGGQPMPVRRRAAPAEDVDQQEDRGRRSEQDSGGDPEAQRRARDRRRRPSRAAKKAQAQVQMEKPEEHRRRVGAELLRVVDGRRAERGEERAGERGRRPEHGAPQEEEDDEGGQRVRHRHEASDQHEVEPALLQDGRPLRPAAVDDRLPDVRRERGRIDDGRAGVSEPVRIEIAGRGDADRRLVQEHLVHLRDHRQVPADAPQMEHAGKRDDRAQDRERRPRRSTARLGRDAAGAPILGHCAADRCAGWGRSTRGDVVRGTNRQPRAGDTHLRVH